MCTLTMTHKDSLFEFSVESLITNLASRGFLWDATISTLNIDVEVNQVQVQHPPTSDTNLKIDKETLFFKALYHPNQMTPMSSDCIKKMYSEMGYKEGTA